MTHVLGRTVHLATRDSCRWDYIGALGRVEIPGSPPVNRHLIVRDHVESTNDHPAASGDRGASLVEYVLLVGLIFLVCLASVTVFGDGVSGSVDKSASRVVTAGGQNYGG